MNKYKICTITEKKINSIPIIFIENDDHNLKPVVFLFHKLLNNKVNELPLAYALARKGYFVINMDMYGHGERSESFDKTGKYEFNNLFKDIYDTAQDVSVIINYLKQYKKDSLLFKNMGAVGISIGGSTALVVGYLVREIQFVASVIGTCNWQYLIAHNLFAVFRFFGKSTPIMQYDKVMIDAERYEPLKNYTQDTIKPILFLNGCLDTSIPIDAVTDYHKELVRLFRSYGKEEYLEFKTYKTGHEVTVEMINDLILWIGSKEEMVQCGR